LHFARSQGGFQSFIGIPLEGGDTLPVWLRIERRGRVDTTIVGLVVRTPVFHSERLTVAPAMLAPDSNTQARIDSEIARAKEASQHSHETPRLWRGQFRLPRPSRITSRYGTTREFNGAIASRHLGTDFAGAVGQPVAASARGVVALVGNFYLAGHAVYIDHGGGLVTGYFHLSRVNVLVGDTVRAGQVIGAVGRSGRVTGPHLHWIARYGGITVDPMSLLELR
jgi:murein DD-endopeptidase MepM/ murein hydrolase activator NlpD